MTLSASRHPEVTDQAGTLNIDYRSDSNVNITVAGALFKSEGFLILQISFNFNHP